MAILQYFGEDGEFAFHDDGGEFTKHSDGYQQRDSAQPNYSLEDGWRWDDDETFAAEHDDAIYAIQDSQALPNQFPIVYFDDYFEGDNYEEPDVNDFEWSGPIQPNAPPSPYIGDLVEFPFDEGYETYTQALDYQTQDAPNFPQNTQEDPWEWDSEQATDDDYPGITSDDPVGPNFSAFVTINYEDPPETGDDDIDDDLIDHFTNYDTAQLCYDDAWDWDSEQDPDDEFASNVPDAPNVNASLVPIAYDDPWHWDEESDNDEEPSPEPPIPPPGPVFTYQDEWDWDLDLYEDPTEADFPQDVLSANAPVIIPLTYADDWGFDEEDVTSSAGVDSYLQTDVQTSPAFPTQNHEWDFDSEFPAPDGWVESYTQADNTTAATAVLAYTDDVATQDDEPEDFFADHFGNVNLDQPSYDDAWDWDETVEDDFPNEPVGNNAPIFAGVIYDDAWDHHQDDAEEFQQDDQFEVVNVPVFTPLQPQDEDFAPWDDEGTDDFESDAALEPAPTAISAQSGYIIYEPFRNFQIATPTRTETITLPVRVFTIQTQPNATSTQANAVQTFDVKDPTESWPLTFVMAPDLASGETLTGTPSVSVTVLQGADPSPQSILNGAAAFDQSQTMVIQPVVGGLNGCDYQVIVTCPTTNPQKVLTLRGRLPVRI